MDKKHVPIFTSTSFAAKLVPQVASSKQTCCLATYAYTSEVPSTKITHIVQCNTMNKNFDFMLTSKWWQYHQQERAAKVEQKTGQDYGLYFLKRFG